MLENIDFKKMERFFWAAAAGGVAVIVVIFSTGWMVTSSTASQQARQQAIKAVDQRLAEICVCQFMDAENTDKKLEKLRNMKYSWGRADYIKKHGWSTMPGSDSPSPGVADNCAKMLMQMAENKD